MKHLVVAIALAAAGAPVSAQPVVIEGVEFQSTAQVGGQTLQLNGAGIRRRAIFKVYAAGLYVPQRTSSAAALLAQKGPRRVAISMLRDVDGDTFSGAVLDGLEANHTERELAGLAPRIETLLANLKAIGEVRQGDLIHFDFTPEAGTRIVVGGRRQGSAIPGDDFFTAVLRVWVGDEPVDPGLKVDLLGP